MKTAEVKTIGFNNNKVDNKADNTGNDIPAKANNLPVSTAFNGESKKDEPKKTETPAQAEKPKETPQADNSPKAVTEQPKAETEKPKEEEPKKVAEEAKPVKPVLNLEGTLKLVEELHRRKIQRDRLLETIDTLEAFEVAQIDEADETESNHFQGCVLTIEDDNRKKFTTKNPVIIQAVAQFVNRMCVDRLSEIEAGITIPV
jgi:hypothetical protein